MLTPDSIVPDPTNPQSLNRFSYTRNNPINLVDPTGHRECGQDCDDVLPHEKGHTTLVNNLAEMTINLIDGNFPVYTHVLKNNIAELLFFCNKYGLNSDETAYVLATAFRETRFGSSGPIEEGAYYNDLVENITYAKAENDYGKGSDRGKDLGNTEEGDGFLFRGRGFAQLTGRKNYQQMQNLFGEKYDVDMVNNPDVVATNSTLAAEFTVYGMVNGSFTGYSFVDAAATDDFFFNSRQIINGFSNAYSYKLTALKYQEALRPE